MRALSLSTLNWQPITELPLIVAVVGSQLTEARRQHGALTALKSRPKCIDNLTIKRLITVCGEQRNYLGQYREQCARWRKRRITAAQSAAIVQLGAQLQELDWVLGEILLAARALRHKSLDRILVKSEKESAVPFLQGYLEVPSLETRDKAREGR